MKTERSQSRHQATTALALSIAGVILAMLAWSLMMLLWYATLLDKSGLPNGNSLRNVFQVLETFDFEKVMKALQDASQVERAYGEDERSRKFDDDATAVREALRGSEQSQRTANEQLGVG
jgi:hypothetical protein